jgi:hypothetical protein
LATKGATPVSTTPLAYVAGHHRIGVLDTEGKFTAGVNNTGDHIFPEIYIDHGVNNNGSKLPLVSKTLAVNCTSGTVAGPLLPL